MATRLLAATLIGATTIIFTAFTSAGHASAPNATPNALTCDDSIKTEFKPDARTSVIQVRAFKKGDVLPQTPLVDNVANVDADLCFVKLIVGPGNPGPAGAPSTSPGIGIEVWLPEKAVWNGRLHAIGGGGWAGTAESILNKISTVTGASDFRSAPSVAAQEGAVTATNDTGHFSNNEPGGQIGGNGDFLMNPDGTINATLWRDYVSRGIHEEVLVAKALATAYYGSAPKRTYWDGGSTGGRQALLQAQRYPDDFDGIVSGYPAINFTRFITGELYPQIVIQRDLGGKYMSADQLNLVSNAAISACDTVGGKHLGYVLDPSVCHYDPTKDATVLCASGGGVNRTAACVSPVQARAINKIWYGMTSDGSVPDPAVDNGWSAPKGKHLWYGLPRGTTLLPLASSRPFGIGPDMVALELQDPKLAMPSFRNASGNGVDGWKSLSYADLSNAFDQGLRLQQAFDDVNTDNPDLSAFRAHGGKLIQFHGYNDPLIFVQGSIDYFQRVNKQMGSSSVDEFYRLYLVPGMAHGTPNGSANPHANAPYPEQGQIYSVLTDWVERGKVPERIEIKSPPGVSESRSFPLCAYPKKATYQRGDSHMASSYSCR